MNPADNKSIFYRTLNALETAGTAMKTAKELGLSEEDLAAQVTLSNDVLAEVLADEQALSRELDSLSKIARETDDICLMANLRYARQNDAVALKLLSKSYPWMPALCRAAKEA